MEQGELLKNPQDIKSEIIGRMVEFMDEYRSHHLEEKADAMETAIRIVKSVFADAMGS